MKTIFMLGLMLTLPVLAQKTLTPPPWYPGKPRTTGGGQGGVEVIPQDADGAKTKYTTRIMLSEPRLWTSADGKSLEGRLIAFEDLVVEAPKNNTPPSPPKPPEKPTVIRDGKIRIQLTNRNIVEIPLMRLSETDRGFVAQAHLKFRSEPLPP